MIVVQTRDGTRRLLALTTPPPGGLEQVAGLLVHQAARGGTGKSSRLLACNLKVTALDRVAVLASGFPLFEQSVAPEATARCQVSKAMTTQSILGGDGDHLRQRAGRRLHGSGQPSDEKRRHLSELLRTRGSEQASLFTGAP